jgi:transglutaminase-like putative cysteine protease
MHLVIAHSTTYRYDAPVPYGLLELRLHPRTMPGQSVVSWQVTVEGGSRQVMFDDEYANRVELISLTAGATETTVTARGEVETVDTAGIVARHLGHAPLWLFLRSTELTASGTAVQHLCRDLDDEDDTISRLHGLSRRIRELVRYETGRTDVESNAEDVLAAGHGVCQDHSHVFISAARRLGFPARYVSGYLSMDHAVQQDASHAWADVWVDGIGWVGFDVSNGISPDERYVRLATGLDYRSAAPVSGVRYGVGEGSLEVDLQVTAREGTGQQ